MPTYTLKVVPGVDQNETPALNQAGISTTQLVRFMYDRNGIGLVQKLGGWTKFYPNTMPAIVRALWGWADTNATSHLAVGTENISSAAKLFVITNGSEQDVTPNTAEDDITPAASSTSGSPIITITDTTTDVITGYDAVYIETHISIGGVVLFGLYPTQINNSSPTTSYLVTAIDIFGNPLPATSTSTTTTVAEFTTVNTKSLVTVTLANHGYVIGNTYPILVSTAVGGITLYGNYIVTTVVDANNFTINASNIASSSASAYINGGNARYIYSIGSGAAPVGSGYGAGGYGSGGYGTGTTITPAIGNPIPAVDWTLDNWGQILISCPVSNSLFQPIYEWDPTSGAANSVILANGPPLNDGVFVAMPQRQIIAWGSTFTGIQDPLLIRWCDVNNFGVWIATVTNEAGSYRIPRGSKIVGGIQGPQQGLIWTDLALWSMQYTGLPYVYSFNEIGTGCGLIARKAAASINEVVYWMGASSFFQLTSDGVIPVPCPIWDVIFQDLDQSNLQKIRVAVNSRFGEIAWYYPTISSGGEVASYVKYNVNLQQWDFGNLGRTAWIDQSVLGPPIGADPTTKYIYQHETSPDADGQPLLASFQTGYFATNDGDVKSFIDQVWPDFKFGYYGGTQSATVSMTFYVNDYPGQTPQVYGPFTITQATTFFSPRFRGRLISIAVSSSDTGSWWRLGACRYRAEVDGVF